MTSRRAPWWKVRLLALGLTLALAHSSSSPSRSSSSARPPPITSRERRTRRLRLDLEGSPVAAGAGARGAGAAAVTTSLPTRSGVGLGDAGRRPGGDHLLAASLEVLRDPVGTYTETYGTIGGGWCSSCGSPLGCGLLVSAELNAEISMPRRTQGGGQKVRARRFGREAQSARSPIGDT
jgi:hypothetical protein